MWHPQELRFYSTHIQNKIWRINFLSFLLHYDTYLFFFFLFRLRFPALFCNTDFLKEYLESMLYILVERRTSKTDKILIISKQPSQFVMFYISQQFTNIIVRGWDLNLLLKSPKMTSTVITQILKIPSSKYMYTCVLLPHYWKAQIREIGKCLTGYQWQSGVTTEDW